MTSIFIYLYENSRKIEIINVKKIDINKGHINSSIDIDDECSITLSNTQLNLLYEKLKKVLKK